MTKTENDDSKLLSDLAFHRISDFSSKYIELGGSQQALSQIVAYNDATTIEKWLNDLENVQKSFTKYDDHFCDLLLQKTVRCCDDYLLSIFINNFLQNKSTTPDNLKKTAEISKPPKTPKEKILAAILGYNFNENITETFSATQDSIFPVHFLHLLSLKGELEERILRTELDIASLRYVELIISDYNENDQSGLRKWAPLYLKIVSEDIRRVVKKIIPSVRLGMTGPYIQSALELPNFVYRSNQPGMELLNHVKQVCAHMIDETDFSKIVQEINEVYSSCSFDLRKQIWINLMPYTDLLHGLSGSVLADLLNISQGVSRPHNYGQEEYKRKIREQARVISQSCAQSRAQSRTQSSTLSRSLSLAKSQSKNKLKPDDPSRQELLHQEKDEENNEKTETNDTNQANQQNNNYMPTPTNYSIYIDPKDYDRDNKPERDIQQMMYDYILMTGTLPEYISNK